MLNRKDRALLENAYGNVGLGGVGGIPVMVTMDVPDVEAETEDTQEDDFCCMELLNCIIGCASELLSKAQETDLDEDTKQKIKCIHDDIEALNSNGSDMFTAGYESL